MPNNTEQYIDHLMSFIGETGNRIAFSKEETQAKIRLIAEMRKLGLDVFTDEAGNIIGLLYSDEKTTANNDPLDVVAIGSHIDSVPDGGNFDGLIGIVSGMAMIKSIQEQGLTLKENIAIIALECEESSVFGKSCQGSKFISGKIDIETLRKTVIISDGFDYGSGQTYGEKLDDCNQYLLLPQLTKQLEYTVFFEPHIEQGPALSDSNSKIGIVSSIAAPYRVKFTITGKGGHDGTIPMEKRRDALVGFNELYNIYRGLRHEMSIKDRLRTNIGVVDIEGSSVNRIPAKINTIISARALDEKLMLEFMELLIERADWKLPELDVKVEAEVLEQGKPLHLPDDLVDTVRKNSADLSQMEMWSGAGHDTAYMNSVCREGAVVFFIPNTGISHEPSEFAKTDDIANSALLLERIILSRGGDINGKGI